MTRKQRIPFPCYKQKLNIDYLISTYKMNETKVLIEKITEGIQEKKVKTLS